MTRRGSSSRTRGRESVVMHSPRLEAVRRECKLPARSAFLQLGVLQLVTGWVGRGVASPTRSPPCRADAGASPPRIPRRGGGGGGGGGALPRSASPAAPAPAGSPPPPPGGAAQSGRPPPRGAAGGR